MDKNKFIDFAKEIKTLTDKIETLKDQQKNIKADIKEAYKNFSEEYDKDEDLVKAGVANYLAYLENKTEFTEFDLALSEIKDAVIYSKEKNESSSISIEEE